MNAAQAITKANCIIWTIQNEQGFMALGSRKVQQLELNAEYGYGDYWEMRDFSGRLLFADKAPDDIRQWNLTGALAGFTTVVGDTELEAIFTLINAFRAEELEEKRQAKEFTIISETRREEEKKAKKAHKKAMKQILEGKFDAAKCSETYIYCESDLDSGNDDYWNDDGDLY